MAAQTGTFVDDARLRARDNSGGPKGPHGISGSDFGDGGKPVNPENTSQSSQGARNGDMTLVSAGNYKRPDKSQKVSRGSY